MATIAWIGLGNMGGPMTANLVEAGHAVRGFDLNEAALSSAVSAGVQRTNSIKEAVEGADVVFTMLPKGDHSRAVYLGDDGVLAHAGEGLLLVDSSTIDVKTSVELHEAASSTGFRFVDAPVSGGTKGAENGSLCFMCGGSEPDFTEASTYIEPMAGRIIHCGGPGAGEAAKIVNNMMLFIQLESCAEGAVLADKLGLDAKTFWDVASVSSGNCWALQTWYPMPGVIEGSAADNEFKATFAASLALKDSGLAAEAAAQLGLDLPAAKVAHAGLQKLVDDGFADRDCSLIIRNIDPTTPGQPKN